MKGDVWLMDVQSMPTSIAKCFLQTLTFGFQIPRHSKFSINVHAFQSGNPLSADIATDPKVGLLEILSFIIVFFRKCFDIMVHHKIK